MKCSMSSAALASIAIGMAAVMAAHAQTTVIPGRDNSTVVIEQKGNPPAVIDVNKDIQGKTKEGAVQNPPSKTGEVSRDNDGNVVETPKENCIKESWMGDRSGKTCN